MNGDELFCDQHETWYTRADMKNALQRVGACECDVLFIHSDVMFGIPNRSLKRQEYLASLLDILLALKVKTLVFPVFTYSFCNGEVFDVAHSKTFMGALNEYARKQPGAKRSCDPLLSVSTIGENNTMFDHLTGDHSLGAGSAFDRLHHTQNVKFLFFGAEFSRCFTYVHYVEKMLDVPYRFDMPFTGTIIDENDRSYQKTQYIHTARQGIKPIDFYHFKDYLIHQGFLHREPLGDREICAISETDAYREICGKINERIDYFLERPFTQADLAPVYTYDRSQGRITHC